MGQTIREVIKNVTTLFMVPTLKVFREDLTNNKFIMAFSKDEIRDVQYENAVYLLFRPTNIDVFREFLEKEYERTQIIEDYDYPKGFVVVVYQLNSKFKKDFQIVRQGRYSKTSAEFQSQFSKVTKIIINGLHRDEISLQYRIFNKTPDLAEFWEKEFDVVFEPSQELWEGYNEENETLTEEKLKEYEQF